jgi:hypothetical protein
VRVCACARVRVCVISQYFPARILKANDDGTYDIVFDDNEKELFVDSALLFLPADVCVRRALVPSAVVVVVAAVVARGFLVASLLFSWRRPCISQARERCPVALPPWSRSWWLRLWWR